MNGFSISNNALSILLVALMLLVPFYSSSQNNLPCDCTKRWTRGAHWNQDGSINDSNNSPGQFGIIKCGSQGQAQTQLKPVAGCTYDSSMFKIDVSTIDCFDPSTGNIVYPINPTNGQPIIWLNFDVRPLAGYFQIQINDNSNDNVAWALYHSTVITNGVFPNPNNILNDSISGDCSSLALVAGGVESSNTWNTLPVPNFVNTTNYYIAIWDQDADGQLWVNNFKARYGCGDAHIPNVLCFLETGNPYIQVYLTGNIYSVKIPVTGINNELFAYDSKALNTNGLSESVCLTNLGEPNPNIFDTLILDYNFGQEYSITVFSANDSMAPIGVTPDTLCSIPYNTGDCKAFYTGSGTALPIELISFNGKEENEKVVLSWSTATETNNDYFTIERSDDGLIFEPIGFVKGAGNSTQILSYKFFDNNTLIGIAYYRLKQTDYNGDFAFSETIQIESNKQTQNLIQSVYPNPANDKLYVTLSTSITTGNLILTDVTGTVVNKKNINQDLGSTFSLNLERFSSGVYFLKLQIKDFSIVVQKIIIQNHY